MKKFILTISREFGCNAREIGRGLAAKLGVPFYDKELVDMAAAKAGINRDLFNGADEIRDKSEKNLLNSFSYGSSTSFYSEKAVTAQSDVIKELANKGESCIFFGRCSDYILREYPNVINVFLYASMDARIRHMAEGYELSEKAAEKLIKRIDKQRHNYYKYVTGKNRGDRDLKHIMIDVHEFGTEDVINIIYNTVMLKFGK
ncbi:MAG: cytidylate kinase-like family protein [Clostridia bacterium]|nr:cytidylate kinase-like family protein [Clostridia bacterium]